VERPSLSTTARPATDNRPRTTATASEDTLTPPDRRTSDVREVKLPASTSQTPPAAARRSSTVVKSGLSSLAIVELSKSSGEALSGRAEHSSGPARVVKRSEPQSQWSQQAAPALTPDAAITDISASTRVVVTHGQGHEEALLGANILLPESNARTCSVLHHRGRTPICGLLHRKDFEVKRICRKLRVDQKVVFVVSWKSTWVPAKLIVKGNDSEYPYVDADGTRWYIRESHSFRQRGGIDEVKVRWMTTKEPVEMLSNAQEAINIFEAEQVAGADEAAQVRQRRVLTFSESHFPRGIVLPQSEEDYAASQRWLSSRWPEIRPHWTLDLYPAFYTINMELDCQVGSKRHGGKSYRWLMKLPQLRKLQWDEEFLKSGASLTCNRRNRASLFIQVTGAQVARKCTRCSHHNLTPFAECVRTAPDQQLWLNGACADCGTQRNVGCDYHGAFADRLGASSNRACNRDKESVDQSLTLPSATRSRTDLHSNSTVLRRNSIAHTAWDRDNDSSDTSDDDSDDDDDDDDEDGVEDGDKVFGGGREAVTEAGTSGSRVFPPFPPKIQVSDFVFDGVSAATGSAGDSAPGSSQKFGGLSLSSPIPSERRGKLPSITNIRERLSRNYRGNGPASHALAQCARERQNGKDDRFHRNIDVDEAPQIQPRSSAGQQSSGDNYTPQPIEQDLLELSSKYDHLESLKHRLTKNAVSASTKTVLDQEQGHAHTAVNQTAHHKSVQINPMVHFSPGPASPARKKRPASMPPLHRRRPFQRQVFMSSGNPASPTDGLTNAPPAAPPTFITPVRAEPTLTRSPKTFLQIRALANIDPNDVHTGCQKGLPCRDYKDQAPTPRDPHAKVYRGTLLEGRKFSLEEAEYIVSRANCFWARKFTVLWARWCEEKGGIENEPRSQVEWFVTSYPELLHAAAKKYCPRRPKGANVLMVPEDVVILDA